MALAWPSIPLLLLGLIVCVQLQPALCTAAGPAGGSAAGAALTPSLLEDLASTRQLVYDFWQSNGPDSEHGGFYGTLDRQGTPVAPTGKGLVAQARHVWAFSTCYLHGYTSSADPQADAGRTAATLRRPTGLRRLQQRQQQQQQQRRRQLLDSQQMAKTAFDFVVQHMHDPSTDMFHWYTTRAGQVLQPNKVIYGQWFVLYSFSQYFTAFKDPQARDLALRCFRAMDAAWHSSTLGGYDELPENQIPPSVGEAKAPPAAAKQLVERSRSSNRSSRGVAATYASAARAVARALPVSGQQQQRRRRHGAAATGLRPARAQAGSQVRTLNVMMHGVEALTALHRVTQGPVVLLRIKEYLHILCTRLQRSQGLIFEEYLPAADPDSKWQPAPGSVVNYGHNLESTWLVADTLDYLQSISAISPSLARQYRETVMSIGAAAVRDGYDAAHGGIFESGLPGSGPRSRVKVWWVQAESMLALWKLHQHYGSGRETAAQAGRVGGAGADALGGGRAGYLHMLARTARFVRRQLTDEQGGGEQFWQVEADGSWALSGNTDKDSKGNMWKASYHNTRSLLFLQKWIQSAVCNSLKPASG